MWCTNVAISVVAGVVVFFVVGSVDYRAKSVFTKNSNICLIRYRCNYKYCGIVHEIYAQREYSSVSTY